MRPEHYWIGVLISNVVAAIMLLACIYRPRTGRLLFALLFTWAAFTNWSFAHSQPEIYLGYADLTPIEFYKDIINGFFAEHIVALVSIIAVCQLLIGISMLLKGRIFKTGCTGGIIFLVAIAPLGIGSGFPATLVMAAGLFVLLRKQVNTYLWQSLKAG
jgi:hypothetical protein